MEIYTNGSAPRYTPAPPKAVPEDGYPRNAENTVRILESTRGDIRQLKAFISAATSLTFGGRIEYRPTSTAPKRAPGRTFSDKCRTIADLRRVNLGVGTGDFFPIWFPGGKIHQRENHQKETEVPRSADQVTHAGY